MIKNADMSEEMQQDAVDIASQALAKYNIEKVSRHMSGWPCAITPYRRGMRIVGLDCG